MATHAHSIPAPTVQPPLLPATAAVTTGTKSTLDRMCAQATEAVLGALALHGEAPLLRGDITTIGPLEGRTTRVPPSGGMAATTMPCEGIRVTRIPCEVCSTVEQTPHDKFHDHLAKPDETVRHGGGPRGVGISDSDLFTRSGRNLTEGQEMPFALPDFGERKSVDVSQRSPAPLPSLTTAFAIRREVFGAVPMTDDGEVRALTLYDVVPAGHIAVPIVNARWSPHLKPGEFAIIEVSDTEPQHGELFGLMIGTRHGPRLHIVQPFRGPAMEGCDGVMFRFGQPKPGTILAADGPLRRDHWHRTCRGRVVGVLVLAEVAHG